VNPPPPVTVVDEYLAALLVELRAIRTALETRGQTPQPAAVPDDTVELREPEKPKRARKPKP
jgi:hypothetical protein